MALRVHLSPPLVPRVHGAEPPPGMVKEVSRVDERRIGDLRVGGEQRGQCHAVGSSAIPESVSPRGNLVEAAEPPQSVHRRTGFGTRAPDPQRPDPCAGSPCPSHRPTPRCRSGRCSTPGRRSGPARGSRGRCPPRRAASLGSSRFGANATSPRSPTPRPAPIGLSQSGVPHGVVGPKSSNHSPIPALNVRSRDPKHERRSREVIAARVPTSTGSGGQSGVRPSSHGSPFRLPAAIQPTGFSPGSQSRCATWYQANPEPSTGPLRMNTRSPVAETG